MSWPRLALLTVFALASWPAPLEARQAPPRVDFRRDVQPILRERCYECHGPEQQMNGFRLDRRADALRGGSQTVIGPGNAEGTLFYRRLVATTASTRMPPTGPLPAAEIAMLKAWIDQGVEWPDDLAGIPVTPPVDPAAERLAALIRDGDRGAVDAWLQANRGAARTRASGGTTPLMAAALYGDADLMTRLMAMGADPHASNVSGATALMWALPDVAKMRLLLDAGVDVNARSDERRTALSIASGIVGAAPAVQLLLEYGASPFPVKADDPQPLVAAVGAGNAEAFRLLLDYGADRSLVTARQLRVACILCAQQLGVEGGPLPRTPPPDRGLRPTLLNPPPRAAAIGEAAVSATTVRAAVERSLPLLQAVAEPFIAKTGCVSCHHNSAVSSAVLVARQRGYRVNEQAVQATRTRVAAYLESWRERTLQGNAIAGAQDTLNYLLVGLSADGHPADAATDAQALWLLRRQSTQGHWRVGTNRPPIESNDIQVTALAMRAVQVYAPKARRAESARAVERARAWLASARSTVTEEGAFRLLGLSWADADADVRKAAARELLALQRPDGGWAQEPTLESDAYATGEALTALLETGMATAEDAGVRRGLAFLLRTQLRDGSWYVKSRAMPIQAYFESGFPHGPDQWISAAATAWAVRALAHVQ